MRNTSKEAGERPGSVEIKFGTLFSVRNRRGITDRVDVVIDVGEADYFSAAKVNQTKQGERELGMAGTAGPENFGQLLGEMSYEEVLSAARKGAELRGYRHTDKHEEILLESSKKPSRILPL